MFILNISGTFCSKEAMAPLAGQPCPPSASGTSHVHPHISDPDQLPQHQTDHSCVTSTSSPQQHLMLCLNSNTLLSTLPCRVM